MTASKTQPDRQEASLFSDEFTTEESSNQETPTTHPERNDSTNYNNLDLPSAECLLANQSENSTNFPPRKKNDTLLEGDHEDWEKAAFTAQLDKELVEYLINSHQGYMSTIVCSITENGLLSIAVDSANVGLINTWLSSDDFNQLDINTAGVFAVNIDKMDEWLSEISTNDTLTITVRETTHANVEENQEMSIQSQGNPDITSLLPTLDTVRRPPDIPELDLTSHIKLPLRELEHILKRCGEYSDHIEIKATEDGVQFKSEGAITTIKKEYNDSTDILTDIDVGMNMHTTPTDSSLFSINKMKPYTKRLKKSQTTHPMRLKFGDEFPFKAQVKLTKTSYSKLMVAPRIQSE